MAARDNKDMVLDLRGIRCPHVVLHARTAMRGLPVGTAIILECTDPLAVIDVPLFVNQTGNTLAAQEQRGELFVFRIIKQK
jgi:tRNA 2-thiouridine synthesizing protein A